MRHPNVKDGRKAPFVIAAGEYGIDRPGSLECDERTLDALDMALRPAITSSMVMIPGEPVHLSLTHPDDFLDDLDSFMEEAGARPVVKVGPVHDEGHLAVLLHVLEGAEARVILDGDVFGSLSETRLDAATAAFIKQKVFPVTALFTPDIDEAEQLLNRPIVSHDQMALAAEEIVGMGTKAVLLKGGQLPGGTAAFDYFTDGTDRYWIAANRLPPQLVSEHKGMIANLATAIAAGLAHGLEMRDAVVMARGFMRRAYRAGAEEPPPFPCEPVDFPWVAQHPASERAPFPAIEGPWPDFYPIVDSFDWVKRLAACGVKTVQLRVKNREGAALEKEIQKSVAFCREKNIRLFINDFWPLAIRHGAYGVHLGQEDILTADIAAIRAAGLRLGLSTHCYHEAAVAHGLRPSYIALGPIYPTKIKAMLFPPQGVDTLKLWKKLLDYPLVVIGGITLDRASEVLDAGADMVSVITDVTQHSDPEARARAWLKRFGGQGCI